MQFWGAERFFDSKLPSEFAKVFQCKSTILLATVKFQSIFCQLSVNFLSNFCMCMCHWIEIYYWNRPLWKIYNWKFQLSFPFSLSGSTKNRKIFIPEFRWVTHFLGSAAWFFDPKNAPLRFCVPFLHVYTRVLKFFAL